jgi:hypothetical protein
MTTSWQVAPKSKLILIPPFECIRTMMTKSWSKPGLTKFSAQEGHGLAWRPQLYINASKGRGLYSLKRCYLPTISCAVSMAEWQGSRPHWTAYNTEKYWFTVCCVQKTCCSLWTFSVTKDVMWFVNIFCYKRCAVVCEHFLLQKTCCSLWTFSVTKDVL